MNIPFAREVGLPKFFARQFMMKLSHSFGHQFLRVRLPTGLNMFLPRDSYFARDVYVTNADVDWGSESLFCRHLDPLGDFVDVGANIGYYTLYMAPAVKRVFSFDPDPRNYAALETNSSIAGNVSVQKAALSSNAGEVALELGDESSISKIATGASAGQRRTMTVKCTTLDAFVQSHGGLRVTGIKLDTEGHELPILRGGVETIRRDQPLILTELMRWPGQGGEREFVGLTEFGDALGYTLFAFTNLSKGLFRRASFHLLRLDSTDTFASHATKMIFLVPERLKTAFEAEAYRSKRAGQVDSGAASRL